MSILVIEDDPKTGDYLKKGATLYSSRIGAFRIPAGNGTN